MSVSSKIGKSKLEIEFEEFETNCSWAAIFESIRNDTPKNGQTMDEAKKFHNRSLNRYRDVNPYDHSRVILKKPGFDYINASHVLIPRAERNYILCQGPLQNTISHFWLMIWEQNTDVIIMLNNLIEKNQVKCAQYWPNSETEEKMFNDVGLKIELIEIRDYCHYMVRFIKLTKLDKEDNSRMVVHFNYVAWPDFGVPKNPNKFLKFLHTLQKDQHFQKDGKPAVVHCSAGIGRSGTFCLVDSCLFMIRNETADNVDVKEVLVEMRKFRMGLIQTPEQLRFSYAAIIKGMALDWDADTEDFLVEESDVDGQGKYDDGCIGDKTSGDYPPIPPPRNQSLEFGKPLPSLPNDVSSSDNDTDSVAVNVPEPTRLDDVSASRLVEVRKRKHMESQQRISHKVHEMVKKQSASEEWKRNKRSIMKNGVEDI